MTETISYDVKVLAERLKHHRHFRIKLPCVSTIYVPEYRPQSLYVEGDIVVFSFDWKCIMIGTIIRTESAHGAIFYCIDCIHRPNLPSNDDSMVNGVNRIKILRRDIRCELLPEVK